MDRQPPASQHPAMARAIAYVEQNGSELERARLRGILGETKVDPKVTRYFASRQNDDGGFPFQLTQGRPSSINATSTALHWLRDLHLLGSSYAERAVTYLLVAQRPDGSWDESPALVPFDPPPFAAPGRPAVRVYLTALATWWLAVLGRGGDESVARALEFLRGERTEGRFKGFLHATWLGAAVFTMIEGPASEVAREAIDTLAAVPAAEWAPGEIAWMLDALGEAGFGPDHALVRPMVALLAERQGDDGGWASADGDAFAVETTLHALRVLVTLAPPTT